MLTFREEQKMKLLMDPQQNLGNVISVNLTKVEVNKLKFIENLLKLKFLFLI